MLKEESIPMAHVPLQSSVLAAAEYLPELQALDIVFNTGEVYRYLKVPMSLYQDLLKADSKGIFFNAHIRNQFSFQHPGGQETLSAVSD
jgi:lysyl-tRNA synthetase class 2